MPEDRGKYAVGRRKKAEGGRLLPPAPFCFSLTAHCFLAYRQEFPFSGGNPLAIIRRSGDTSMKDASSSSPPPRKDEARTRRYVFATIAFLCLSLILGQIFLHQTSVGSPKFVRGTFLLWTVTVLVILALLILATVLGRNLIKLYFEHKSGRVGSRFKTRMVTVSVILSL